MSEYQKITKKYRDNKIERNQLHRENRELVFTTPETIRTLLNALLDDFPYLRDMQWHDIVAADGRWEKILREEYSIMKVRSSDIVPLNDTVEELDLFNISPNPDIFYFGNLPFTKAKKIYSKFNNCHRFFLGGAWMNKLGGKNYSIKLKPFSYEKHFENIDGSNPRILWSANYSKPYEPIPDNITISGDERRVLAKEEKKKYLQLGFVTHLLKDDRHKELKLLKEVA